jgi:hypothetical protein
MSNFASNKKVQLLAPILLDMNVDLVSILNQIQSNWDEPITDSQLDFILNMMSIVLTPSVPTNTKSAFLDSILNTESFEDLVIVERQIPPHIKAQSLDTQILLDTLLFDAIRLNQPKLNFILKNKPLSVLDNNASFANVSQQSSLSNTQRFLIFSSVLLGATLLVVRVAR